MTNVLLLTEPVVPSAPFDDGLSEQDYLAEYARCIRHANTELLLGALDRLEDLVRSRRNVQPAISLANNSASTLPPDSTLTTILSLTTRLPASSAASPMAPPGSTTSLSSSKA